MANKTKLFWIRFLHTAIYLVMAAACVYTFLAGIIGFWNNYVAIAILLIVIEGVVFFSNGMVCPLTNVAKKLGAEKGYVFDTFLPETFTKYTFRFFGTIFALGLIGLVIRFILGQLH